MGQVLLRKRPLEPETELAYNIASLPERPILTDQQIQELLGTPKTISEKTPANGYKEENNQRRCDLELETTADGGVRLSVFIRQNTKFIENFSIGLCYHTNLKSPGTVTLVRYNGAHGESSRHPDGHYAQSHIHHITEQEIASGSSQPQERHREITDRYSTFEQALRIFFDDFHVANYGDYFPELLQLGLLNGHQ